MAAPVLQLQLDKNLTYLLGISGGGDSMALGLLAKQQGFKVAWAHVNHGWNPSEDEAEALVRAQAKLWQIPLYVTRGQGRPNSNAEAKARTEREVFYKMLCTQHGYAGIVLAHTQTDVAENFLLRAGKGSGLTGLAAMPKHVTRQGLTFFRPLLGVPREALRAYLIAHQQPWHEDPDNTAKRNQRAKIRALLPTLAAAGVAVHGLAAAAQALARANEALPVPTPTQNLQALPLAPLLALPEERALRQLGAWMRQCQPTLLPPRTRKRQALLLRLQQPTGTATLGKIVWRWRNGVLQVCPEA
jgi:tRNA(Ile)-lysidine synthase